VWDTPQKPSAGKIATGLPSLPAQHAATMTATNHAQMIFERLSGESFEYFAGSAGLKWIGQCRKIGMPI
jgi:hypothetical protein